tara:strand:+ start:121 stop:426 length:306 start_codon:yes stop_codon:yes gene_type:complete
MDVLSQNTKEIINKHRNSIDRLDAILVYALAERFKQTESIGKLKADNKLLPTDSKREEKQFQRLQALSCEAGLDDKFAKKFLDLVISEVITRHKKLQNESQ